MHIPILLSNQDVAYKDTLTAQNNNGEHQGDEQKIGDFWHVLTCTFIHDRNVSDGGLKLHNLTLIGQFFISKFVVHRSFTEVAVTSFHPSSVSGHLDKQNQKRGFNLQILQKVSFPILTSEQFYSR